MSLIVLIMLGGMNTAPLSSYASAVDKSITNLEAGGLLWIWQQIFVRNS